MEEETEEEGKRRRQSEEETNVKADLLFLFVSKTTEVLLCAERENVKHI